jgi:hypothetical protein
MAFPFYAMGDDVDPKESIITWDGEFNYEIMQLIKDTIRGGDVQLGINDSATDKKWLHRVTGEAGLKVQASEKLFFKAGFRVGAGTIGSGLSECKVVYSHEKFSFTGGLFNFKYNQDSKNLGEYLILSGCYPGYIFSGRDWAAHTGLMIETDIVPGLKQNLLVLSEMEQVPFYDLSIVYLASYNLMDFLNVGAGIMAYHLVPVSRVLTNIDSAAIQVGFDEDGNPINQSIDYSHRGLKLSAKLSLDIKAIFGSPDFFGKEDLKLYGEWAWLGVKNYPVFYDTASQRMPVMFGVNLPAFGLLDYCAVEAEFYSSPHDNTPPYKPDQVYPHDVGLGSKDDWKWSVSLKRSLTDNLALHFRAARDHLRLQDASGAVERYERIVEKQHWYWSSELILSF